MMNSSSIAIGSNYQHVPVVKRKSEADNLVRKISYLAGAALVLGAISHFGSSSTTVFRGELMPYAADRSLSLAGREVVNVTKNFATQEVLVLQMQQVLDDQKDIIRLIGQVVQEKKELEEDFPIVKLRVEKIIHRTESRDDLLRGVLGLTVARIQFNRIVKGLQEIGEKQATAKKAMRILWAGDMKRYLILRQQYQVLADQSSRIENFQRNAKGNGWMTRFEKTLQSLEKQKEQRFDEDLREWL